MSDLLQNSFVMSDVDGTLLDDNYVISEKNKMAIAELTGAGGLFTIATGRGVAMAKPIISELELRIPTVIFNGAAIYDGEKDEMLWYCELPDEAYDYLAEIHEHFKTAAIEVLIGDKVYVPAMNELEMKHLSLGGVEPIICTFDEIPKNGRIKSLIVDTPENIDEIAYFIDERRFNKTHWVRSSPIYYEMLPQNVNKGTGFKKLIEIMNCNDRFIVGVGDYMNDTEMLKMADLGVAVDNAQSPVKEVADIIVSDNNHDAVYEVIEYLKTYKGWEQTWTK